MIKDSSKKIKLLKLRELLQQESDSITPITTEGLINMLSEANIITDRITLRRDIEALREYGIPVKETRIGHQKAYYLEEKSFSIAELKILMDAVQAASFIPRDKTMEIVDKIADMGGSRRKDILDHNIICFNTRKHSNASIYETIDILEKAVRNKVQASFIYYDLNENKEKIYRKEKRRYVVNPSALIFYEDNYYLMTYSEKYDGVTNYRVDRMEDVEVSEKPVCQKAILDDDDLAEYTKQAFKMYNGRVENVSLEFEESVLNAVYDKFGEGTPVIRVGKNRLVAGVSVQVSPTFMGWIFQFGKKMKILSPEGLEEEYKERAKEILKIYNTEGES